MSENNKQSPTIFVVDDDRLILTTLSSDLVRAGYMVESFENGMGALEAYKKSPPDLVLLDIRMPEMDGIETARAMLDVAYRPILVLSAYDDVEAVNGSIEVGVSGYLVKPLQPSQLFPTIEAALARSHDIGKLLKNNDDLVSNTEKNRLISTAVGIIMAKSGLDRDQAFSKLRDVARSKRRPLVEVSKELVESASLANEAYQKSLSI